MIREVTSEDNALIKKLKKLRQKKYRDQMGLYLAEGANAFNEALLNKVKIIHLVMSETFWESGTDEAAEALSGLTDSVTVVPDLLFNKISGEETPQGVLLVLEKPVYELSSFYRGGSCLILDRLGDPGNIGTIIRTADAAGFDGILVVKGTADIFSPKVARAAAGSLFRVPVRFAESCRGAFEEVKSAGLQVACTCPRAELMHYDADLSRPTAFVIGNEAAGADDFFIDNSDILIKIPMWGTIESLNASVAAAVIMYEAVRQSRMKGD